MRSVGSQPSTEVRTPVALPLFRAVLTRSFDGGSVNRRMRPSFKAPQGAGLTAANTVWISYSKVSVQLP